MCDQILKTRKIQWDPRVISLIYSVCPTSQDTVLFSYRESPFPTIAINDINELFAYKIMFKLFESLATVQLVEPRASEEWNLWRTAKTHYDRATHLFWASPNDSPFLKLLEEPAFNATEIRNEIVWLVHSLVGWEIDEWHADIMSVSRYAGSKTRVPYLFSLIYVMSKTLLKSTDPMIAISEQMISLKIPEWYELSPRREFINAINELDLKLSNDFINFVQARYMLGMVLLFLESQDARVPITATEFQGLKKFFKPVRMESLKEVKLTLLRDGDPIRDIYAAFFDEKNRAMIPSDIVLEIKQKMDIQVREIIAFNLKSINEIIKNYFDKVNIFLILFVRNHYAATAEILNSQEISGSNDPNTTSEELGDLQSNLNEDTSTKFIDVLADVSGISVISNKYSRKQSVDILGGDKSVIFDSSPKLFPRFVGSMKDKKRFGRLDHLGPTEINKILAELFPTNGNARVFYGTSITEAINRLLIEEETLPGYYILIVSSYRKLLGIPVPINVTNVYLIYQDEIRVISMEMFNASNQYMAAQTSEFEQFKKIRTPWSIHPVRETIITNQDSIFPISKGAHILNSIWYIDNRIRYIPVEGMKTFNKFGLFGNMENYVGKVYFSERIKPVMEKLNIEIKYLT